MNFLQHIYFFKNTKQNVYSKEYLHFYEIFEKILALTFGICYYIRGGASKMIQYNDISEIESISHNEDDNPVLAQDNIHNLRTMQENLYVFRILLDWSTEDLAKRMGVSKQTVSNIEKIKQELNLCQYITLRLIFDYELVIHPENTFFATIYCMIWEENRRLSKEDIQNISTDISNMKICKNNITSVQKEIFRTNVKNYNSQILDPELAKKYFGVYKSELVKQNCINFNHFENEWVISWLQIDTAEKGENLKMLSQNTTLNTPITITNSQMDPIINFIENGFVKVYNGTKHPLPYFDLSKYRSSISKLPKKFNDSPALIIDNMHPLSVIPKKQPVFSTNDTTQYIPEIPDNYYLYDIIVVSKLYIQEVERKKLIQEPMYEDFKDRLYFIDPVNKDDKIIGIKGFRKVYPYKNMERYISDLNAYARPSLISLTNCLDENKGKPGIVSRMHFMTLQNLTAQYAHMRMQEAKGQRNLI